MPTNVAHEAYSAALETAVPPLVQAIRDAGAAIAQTYQMPLENVTGELAQLIKETLSDTGLIRGNAVFWRCRARVYDAHHLDTPEVDSDPDRPLEAPGAEVIRGLPDVVAWGCAFARMHHHTPCAGLGKTHTRALQTARAMLSRRGNGTAVITIEYTTTRMAFAHETPAKRYMTLKIAVVKVGSEGDTFEAEPPRKMPSTTILKNNSI